MQLLNGFVFKSLLEFHHISRVIVFRVLDPRVIVHNWPILRMITGLKRLTSHRSYLASVLEYILFQTSGLQASLSLFLFLLILIGLPVLLNFHDVIIIQNLNNFGGLTLMWSECAVKISSIFCWSRRKHLLCRADWFSS